MVIDIEFEDFKTLGFFFRGKNGFFAELTISTPIISPRIRDDGSRFTGKYSLRSSNTSLYEVARGRVRGKNPSLIPRERD